MAKNGEPLKTPGLSTGNDFPDLAASIFPSFYFEMTDAALLARSLLDRDAPSQPPGPTNPPRIGFQPAAALGIITLAPDLNKSDPDWGFITTASDTDQPGVATSTDGDGLRGAQVVFIDSAVDGAELLAAGVKPGVIAVILPAGQDGVSAIAAWLSNHNAQDLSSIAIVAHGASGLMLLGNAALESATLGKYGAELHQIGAALSHCGDILLYGCDVAQGDGGVAFIQQLAAATDADIAASSHVVGAAAAGGDFLLDVNSGLISADTPFTAATVTSFADVLPTATNQLFFTTNGAPSPFTANGIRQIGVSGTVQVGTPITLRSGDQQTLTTLPGVVVDPAAGKYFVVNSNASTANQILQGNVITPGTLTPIFSLPAQSPISHQIMGLAIDQPAATLYYTVAANTANQGSIGVWKISEIGGTPTQVVGGFTSANVPRLLALDLPNNLVFFTDNAGVGAASSRLWVGNVISHTATVLATSTTGRPLIGVAVNNGTVYYSTANAGTIANNSIFAAPYTVTGAGSTANATLGAVSTLYAGANAGNPLSLTIDPASGLLYTAGSVAGTTPGVAQINVGTITGGGSIQQLFTLSDANGVNGNAIFLETTPTITASGTVTHVQGGAAVAAAPGVLVRNPSGFNLASAKVEITGGNFVNDGDTLTAITAGTGITASFLGDTLTLTGNDTLARYQQVLASVTYKSTATDPTNGAANPTRTLSWTLSDGLISSSTPTTTISIHGLPTVVAGGVASFFGGGAPVTLDAGLTLSDPFSTTLSSAQIAVNGLIAGDVLNFINQGGIIGNYTAATGTLSLSGVASLGSYQTALRSITYSFNPTNGDPTGGGSATSRVITWAVNDGVTTSNAATSSMNVIHVAPTITTSGMVTFGIGVPNPVLDPTLTVVAPNSFGLLHGATVTIQGGAFATEADVLTASTAGTAITFSFDPITDVATLSGADTVANYQAVLRSVTVGSTSPDPTNGGLNPTRTFSWVVNDGVAASAASTSFADVAVCFAAGTRIATRSGGVAVEALRPGDTVLTAAGAERPVLWLGERHVDLTRHPRPEHLQPIRILPDAFAPGVPARDLRLSPAHAVFLDGLLIPVELLVNGATIIQETDCRTVTYFHVELDAHDVLLAEGLPAESYLDTGNRDFFANGGGPIALHPHLLTSREMGQAEREQASCLPFADDAPRIEPLWRRLATRATTLGHRMAAPTETTDNPDLHIMIGNRRLPPVSRDRARHVFVLPATDQPVELVSRNAIPCLARPWLGDRRRLGVMVGRLTWRGPDGEITPIPLDHPALNAGWWAPEWHDAATLRRWTDGRATLPIDTTRPGVLEVDVADTLPYDQIDAGAPIARGRIAA